MDVKRCGCRLTEHTTVGRLRMEVDFYKGKVLLAFPWVGTVATGDKKAMCGRRPRQLTDKEWQEGIT